MYGPIAPFGGTNFPDPNREYIELRNITDQAVPLYDPANPANTWRVTGGIDFTFPQNLSIPAGGYLILTNLLPADFRSRYPTVPSSAMVLGPISGFLNNAGESFRLQRPGAPVTGPTGVTVPYITVDELSYDNKSPWPTAPDQTGPSLVRKSAGVYGDDPTDWQASSANGGSPGSNNFPNGNPVVDAGLDATIKLTDNFTRVINFADGPDDVGQTYTATVVWGDGSSNSVYNNVSSGFTITHDFPSDGQYTIQVTVADSAGGSGSDTALIDVKISPIASPPEFFYQSGPRQITVSFNEDVSASLLGDSTDLTVHNLDTNTDLPGVVPTWNASTFSATWTFPSLPNGNFHATLHKDGITDPSGNGLAQDGTLEFWFLNGDANRDRSVDFNDLVALAQNYNTTGGKTYALGDFSGDGNVDFNDLVLLAQNYNTSLPGGPAPSATANFSSDLAAAFAAATSEPTSEPTTEPTTKPTSKPTPKPLTPKPTPKPAPAPVIAKPLPVKKPAPAPVAQVAVVKTAKPVVTASKAIAPAPVAPSVFGIKPIKVRRDVLGLFA
jgi:hypothetical protein